MRSLVLVLADPEVLAPADAGRALGLAVYVGLVIGAVIVLLAASRR